MIRPMLMNDIPECLQIIAQCWEPRTGSVAEPELMEMFNGGAWRPRFYVHEYDGVIGMAGYGTSWLSYGVYNLFWVCVRPDQQRHGFGRQLVQRCLDDIAPFAKAIMLMTHIPEFYSPFGFKEVDRIQQPTTDDVLMIARLKQAKAGRGIYIASKTAHAPRWRRLRAAGVPIISTWIDEAGPGETDDFSDLWSRCESEASRAKSTIVYREPGEVLKGTFVEVGAALASRHRVFAVGCDEFSFVHHPLVTICATFEEALKQANAEEGK